MIDFNPPAKRPYVIVAPSYDPMTESTRVLHELCHALNLAGAPAYIALVGAKPEKGAFHPGLLTPLPAWLDPDAIVLYPPHLLEVNPLKARTRMAAPVTEAAFRAELQSLDQFIASTQGMTP